MLDPITTESMAGIYIAGVEAPEPTLPPVITSTLKASGRVGAPLAYQITADNEPTSFGASKLPPGLSIDTTSGVISGTPTRVGNYRVTITAGNAAGTDSAIVKFKISKGSQKISFSTPGNQKYAKNRRFPLNATSSSGLGVTLVSSNPRVLSIQGNTAIIRARGAVIDTASQRGNANYEPAQNVTRRIIIR